MVIINQQSNLRFSVTLTPDLKEGAAFFLLPYHCLLCSGIKLKQNNSNPLKEEINKWASPQLFYNMLLFIVILFIICYLQGCTTLIKAMISMAFTWGERCWSSMRFLTCQFLLYFNYIFFYCFDFLIKEQKWLLLLFVHMWVAFERKKYQTERILSWLQNLLKNTNSLLHTWISWKEPQKLQKHKQFSPLTPMPVLGKEITIFCWFDLRKSATLEQKDSKAVIVSKKM